MNFITDEGASPCLVDDGCPDDYFSNRPEHYFKGEGMRGIMRIGRNKYMKIARSGKIFEQEGGFLILKGDATIIWTGGLKAVKVSVFMFNLISNLDHV